MKLTNLGEEFELWKKDFHGVKDETRRFLEHLLEDKKKIGKSNLWKHQLDAVLRVIYSYEVLGKNNLLLNIVTGGGKTAIIGACVSWLKMSYKLEKFLILVPNLIV